MFDPFATQIAHEVAIRTLPSFTLELEIEGRWPVQRPSNQPRKT